MPGPVVLDVGDVLAELPQALHELIRLALGDARIRRALHDEQRTADVLGVGQRRARVQFLGIAIRVADPAAHEALPRRRVAPDHRHQVRRTERLDRHAPVLRQPGDRCERRKTAVAPPVDPEPIRVDPRLRRRPRRERLQVGEVDPAPVLMDRALP